MKKTLFKAVILALCAAFTFVLLTSCSLVPLRMVSEEDQCEEFLKRVDKKMNYISSYTQDAEVDLAISYLGETVKIKSTSTVYIVAQRSDFKYLYTDRTTIYTGDSDTETIKSTEGYQNGFMFSTYSEANGRSQQIKSKISAEDYLEYLENKEGGLNLDITSLSNDAATQSIEKTEDGEWVAKFSNLGADTLKIFDEYLEDITDAIEECPDLEDVEITITADKNLYLKKYLFKFIYEESENSSSNGATPLAAQSTSPEIKITMSCDFKDINETELKDSAIDGYTEFEDLRELDMLKRALDSKKNSGSGKFVLQLKALTSVSGETQSSINETDTVTYSFEDDTVSYEIIADAEEYNVKINYDSGIRDTVVTQNGATVSSSSEISTDYVEKASIGALMDMGSFDKTNVKSIEASISLENVTTYEIELIEAYDETITELMNAYDLELTISDVKLTMKVNEDNELIYYKYELRIRLEKDYLTFYQKTVATCTFE